MEYLRQYQADIMLLLSGICGLMGLLVYLTKSMSKTRKLALMQIEFTSMLLLIADRQAYIYRGDTSTLGWWMVRISNFLVFFLTLAVIYSFNLYLIDLYTHEGGLEKPPKRLRAVKVLALIGMALVIISQFTGLYYTFDEMNRYQRAPGFLISYLIPMTILLLQISVILQNFNRLSRNMSISLLLFSCLSVIASVCQVFMYGVSLQNITIVATAALLYIFALQDMSRELERSRKQEIESYRKEQENMHDLFEQTAEALAAAIDAKDKYTHGHSARVAMYSTQIARDAGKSEQDCEKVYFAALLHDVGKIGVPDAIINKDGKLTDEEFSQIKLHPVYGNRILSSIQQSPYLSIGAHYHHERYDGRGYPDGLKGEDIPDIARIIAVADAYDAMTSKRSYREPIPQQKVREELVKGMGTQFDPQYAKIMLHLIDLDLEYSMREREVGTDDTAVTRIQCDSVYHDCSTGIPVTDKTVCIHLYSRPLEGFPESESLPVLILFDALDARVHEDEFKKKDLAYCEYAQIRFSGESVCESARKIETDIRPQVPDSYDGAERQHYTCYLVEAVKIRDHVRIRISDGRKTVQHILALPDSTRFAYISLSGNHCIINNIRIDRDECSASADEIPRIAEEISYIRGCPQGDLPNVQVDGWRTESTQGVPIRDGGMKLSFHGQSLPTARLVWHCPFVIIYTSADGQVNGQDYREYLLLRLDGETWDSDEHVENETTIDHTRSFPGWNAWKERNRQGLDFAVSLRRSGSIIEVETENLGIAIFNKTTIKDEISEVYAALTGDQCAITDIHVAQDTEGSV